jgi:hypothetical protein
MTRHKISVGLFCAITLFRAAPSQGQAVCSTMLQRQTSSTSGFCSIFSTPTQSVSFSKTYNLWAIYVCFNGGGSGEYSHTSITSHGTGACGFTAQPECKPQFSGPSIFTAGGIHFWTETVTNRAYSVLSLIPPAGFCHNNGGTKFEAAIPAIYCNSASCDLNCTNTCNREDQELDPLTCECVTVCPVVIDVDGNGLNLTSSQESVPFDLNPGGPIEQLSWTAPNSDDAFLVLDRNSNGRIDDGTELFSSFAPQAATGENRNGFEALAVFDSPAEGGNGDGLISVKDAVFSRLALWRDANHDGESHADELSPLAGSGITEIDLDYRESRKTDEYGNQLRYRTKANGAGRGHWVWDVILTLKPQ